MNSANAIWSEVDFDFTVLPNPRGSVGRVMPGGPQPMAISPYSDHIEAAWTFLKWINRTDIQAWISGELNMFPPTRRSAIPYIRNPIIQVFGSELENQLVYTTVGHSNFVQSFGGQLDAVLRNEQSIPAAVAQVQHDMTVALQEAWK